jgi:hypothetical protein
MPVPAHRRASKRLAMTYAFRWREYTLRVVHTPDVVNCGWSHLEVETIDPVGAPLPLGLASRFVHEIEEEDLQAAGGPVSFLTAWLEREAIGKGYAEAMFRWRQGRLF